MIKKMEKNQLKKLAENNLWERLDILCSIKAKLKDCSHIIEEEDNLNVSIQEQINNINDILETLINTKN